MDKASAYGVGDCRFESCRGQVNYISPAQRTINSLACVGRVVLLRCVLVCRVIFWCVLVLCVRVLCGLVCGLARVLVCGLVGASM